MIYITNLYQNIIIKGCENATELKVCTGYSSSEFVKKVLDDCPTLKIELFLGMTVYGISSKNHDGFIKLIENYKERIKVWYQITEPPTHTKSYTFFKNEVEIQSYIGSANFTKNGFIKWNEMLISSELSLNDFYEAQKCLSMLANNEEIEKYIFLYEEDEISTNFIEEEEEQFIYVVDKDNQDSVSKYVDTDILSKKNNFTDFRYRRRLTIIPEKFPLWKRKGINASLNGGRSTLLQTATFQFDTIFPLDKKIRILTKDGNSFVAYVDSSPSILEIEFTPSLHTYISKRIGHCPSSYLTREILVDKKMNDVRFLKIEEDLYEMIFEIDDELY